MPTFLLERLPRREYQCMCFGLACAPRIFTKLLKAVFSYLHPRGFVFTFYLDDSLPFDVRAQTLESQLKITLDLFMSLDFSPNYDNSISHPSQNIWAFGLHN